MRALALAAAVILAGACDGLLLDPGDGRAGGVSGAGGGVAGGAAGGVAGGAAGGTAGGAMAGGAGTAGGGTAGGAGTAGGGTAGGGTAGGGTAGGGTAGGGTAGGGTAGGGTAGGGTAGGGTAGGGTAGGGTAGGAAGGGALADGGTYGDPLNGFPSWRERTIEVLTNAVRFSPTEYKASLVYAPFMPSLNTATVLDSNVYPATTPLYWDYGLNQAARQHSQEMADFNYFSHNSLDGGGPFQRVAQYYTRSGTLGENIAAGTHGSELQAMHQWLCDQNGATCCADGQSCDGHRRNIMAPGFRALGVGYGFSSTSTYDHYWTQDFGGIAAPPQPPLIDGTHLLTGASSTRFLANFYAAAAAQSVTLVIDGAFTPMAVDLGTSARGTWFVLMARGTTCRSYFFLATTTAGATWRYPSHGVFRTRGEGTCAEEYVP